MASVVSLPIPIRTARDAADLVAPFLTASLLERLAVLHLDRDQRCLRRTELEGFSVDSGLPIRLILAAALDCDARGLIVAHNHPAGDAQPSAADRLATRCLVDAAAPLGIAVHDHLVFAGDECCSFRALGLL